MATVDRLFLEDDGQRLYVEAHEGEACQEMDTRSLDERFGIETSLSCNEEEKSSGRIQPPRTAWKSNVDLGRNSRTGTPSSVLTSASSNFERNNSFSHASSESAPDEYMTIDDMSD